MAHHHNLSSWLNLISKTDSYHDITVIDSDNVEVKTSKLFVYCKYPFLADCLETSNLVIIDDSLALNDEKVCSEDIIDYISIDKVLIEEEYHVSVDKVESKDDFICNFCGKKYYNRQKLSKHIRDFHGTPKKCSHCDKTFSRSYELSRHLKIHSSASDNYDYECKVCQVKIKSKDKFKQHLLLHNRDQSKFRCTTCNKSFSNKYNLDVHEKIHNNVKFVCPFCDKSYSFKTNLTRHKCSKK